MWQNWNRNGELPRRPAVLGRVDVTDRPTAGADSSDFGAESVAHEDEEVRSRKVTEGKRLPVVQAVRWTVGATLTRQGFQIVGAVVLARILGPETYGVISLAMLYTVVSALILDQGLAAALIQRPMLDAHLPGAVATLNLGLAAVVGSLTFVAAPWIETFFDAPPLATILRILGAGLLLKAAVIVPRALLTRHLNFKLLGKADIAGAVLGTAAGVIAAVSGAASYSVVYLTFGADLTLLVLLLAWKQVQRPNFRLGLLPPILPFSVRIFATNVIAAFSRNTDNVLVGRYLGVASLSFYAMAYRVLVIPVQMVGQTAARFMFPLLSREARDKLAMANHLYTCSQVLAAVTVPVMVWVACAADGLVELVLGDPWAATAPILAILAVAGARETIFYVTPSLMKATGRASLNLRFEILSTFVQVLGIVVGLQFGLIGVAVGYTVAGFAVTPVLMLVQRNLAGLSLVRQVTAILPSVVCSVAGAAGFFAIGRLNLATLQGLLLGSVAYLLVFALIGSIAFKAGGRILRRLSPSLHLHCTATGHAHGYGGRKMNQEGLRVTLVTPDFEGNSLGRTFCPMASRTPAGLEYRGRRCQRDGLALATTDRVRLRRELQPPAHRRRRGGGRNRPYNRSFRPGHRGEAARFQFWSRKAVRRTSSGSDDRRCRRSRSRGLHDLGAVAPKNSAAVVLPLIPDPLVLTREGRAARRDSQQSGLTVHVRRYCDSPCPRCTEHGRRTQIGW